MLRLSEHLQDGARPAGELAAALGVERSTLVRAFRREASDLIRIGRARNSVYAARRALPGLSTDEYPIFRVDEQGEIHRAGSLITLAANESVWLPDETVQDGLPPEIQDVAPAGFLGRSFAQRHAALDLPDDVRQWSDHHVLIALSRRGEDLPGNLVIGSESFDRWQALSTRQYRVRDFADLADTALAGEPVGSSAGGEQPKFSVPVDNRHLLVKFASGQTDTARRWQDLLALEHLSLQVLQEAGLPAASASLHGVGNYRCLAVRRYDRTGLTGRRAVMTLSAASGTDGISWSAAAANLRTDRLLSATDAERIALLDAFGAQIANTDRHLHNLLLFPEKGRFSLAPAFDQLPMAYAPPTSGNFRTTVTAVPKPTTETFDVWNRAMDISRNFWSQARKLDLSGTMTEIVAQHADRM